MNLNQNSFNSPYNTISKRYAVILSSPEQIQISIDLLRVDIRELTKFRYTQESPCFLQAKLKALELIISVFELLPVLNDYTWAGVTNELTNLREDIKGTLL